ncbi:hypothetical protein V5O48_017642, partial [Marasmius crinis-equi]
MPHFEFAASIALASCTLASGAAFLLNRPKEGKIKLPVQVEDGVDSALDPFDVAVPEDFVDGYPIEEDVFWNQVGRRKYTLSFLAATIFILQSLRLGLSLKDSLGITTSLVGNALDVYYAFFLLALCVRSLKHRNVSAHSESVLHISALTVISALLLTTLAILPTTSSPALRHILPATLYLRYTVIALYIASSFIALSTPQGPPLHYPPSAIYLPKTVESITNMDKENVTGADSSSPWGYLMFSYTTKVVMLGNIAQSLEIGDLPILPANMRSVLNFSRIRKVAQTVKFWSAKPGSGWNVGYQLLRVNFGVLTAQFWLAVVSAVLFYLPPWFLNLLVKYLQSDPERRDRSWGWVYVFGLIIATALMHLVSAQLWSISTTVIETRFKIQLNSLLYAKTLVRKDAVSSSGPSTKSDEEDGAGEDEKDDENDFSTKAQIMTLMTTDTDR